MPSSPRRCRLLSVVITVLAKCVPLKYIMTIYPVNPCIFTTLQFSFPTSTTGDWLDFMARVPRKGFYGAWSAQQHCLLLVGVSCAQCLGLLHLISWCEACQGLSFSLLKGETRGKETKCPCSFSQWWSFLQVSGCGGPYRWRCSLILQLASPRHRYLNR